MYEAFFKLGERPFAAAPLASRYFPAAAIENARKTLTRCIERAEGAALVIGPSGTGKSLLLQVLAEQFRQTFAVASLASGQLGNRRGLLQAILFELGLPYRGLEEGELRLSLCDYLAPGKMQSAGLLLLVDEAHRLPWRLMEELRMITNLAYEGQPRVRLVLAGAPLLEERFASPRMESFSQRLAARCYLEAFSRDETFAYVSAQVAASSSTAVQIFADDALQSVFRATDGIPRLINQLCDHALILASVGGLPTLGAEIIEEAWADLQQLPSPWTAHPRVAVSTNPIVEFGGLDDDCEVSISDRREVDDEPEAIPFRGRSPLFGSGDPEQDLDAIDEQLAEIEEDFQPAGSIGPEVELQFDPLTNPFGEPFADEEIVLDRYASLEADVFSRRPQVSSKEGRELSALLSAYSINTSQSGFSATTSPAAKPIVEPSRPQRESQTAADVSRTAGAAHAPTQPAMANSAQQSPAVEVDEFSDDDLIVIDEDEILEVTVPVRPAQLVRRQEYRQLFAKLRRG